MLKGADKMDFSSLYFNMCKKAQELQQEWKPEDFDFYILKQEDDNYGMCGLDRSDIQIVDIGYSEADVNSFEYKTEYDYYKTRCIWMPRQDQLQEIMEPDKSKVYLIIEDVIKQKYYDSSKNDFFTATDLYSSMEQLWLAYVMKDKFGKIWDGNQWITVDK